MVVIGYRGKRKVTIYKGPSGWLVQYDNAKYVHGSFFSKERALGYVGPLTEEPELDAFDRIEAYLRSGTYSGTELIEDLTTVARAYFQEKEYE